MANEEVYLRAILAVVARQTFPVADLAKLVSPFRKAGDKQVAAYNLCDGGRTQSEIAREIGLDPGAFSRTVSRWIELGILIRVGEKRDSRLIHLYPIPVESSKKDREDGRVKGRSSNSENGDSDQTSSA